MKLRRLVSLNGKLKQEISTINTGTVDDGDYGDITVSSSGTVWTIDANAVSLSKLAQLAALSVLGNPTNGVANMSAITAGSDYQILRRSGTALAFGSIDLSQSAAVGSSRLAFSNIAQLAAISVLGNPTNATANMQAITATTNGQFLRCNSGTSLAWSTLILPNTATQYYVPYATAANTIGESGNFKYDTTSLILLNAGAESTPSIVIGSVGNGIYYPSANTLGFTTNSQQRFQIDGTSFNSITAGGGYIRRAAGAAATPTYAFNSTINTGMWLNGSSLSWSVGGTHYASLDTSGRLYIGGSTSPSATLHLRAGSTAASSSPIKLSSGTVMTAAEVGAIEFTTDDLFFTITTAAARKRVSLVDPSAGLTSGRVACVTTNGRLTDYSGMTYNGTTLVVGGSTYSGNFGVGSQVVGLTGTSVSARLYRTTNGGSDITPYIHLGSGTFSAGEMAFTYRTSEGIGIVAHNGTRFVMRAAVHCINLTNTAGSESGDMALYTQSGGTAISQKMRISGAGNIVAGAEAALATSATNGFLYIPTCAGTPTGVPTAYTGKVAIVFDTTNNKLYIYNGAWLGGTNPAAFV